MSPLRLDQRCGSTGVWVDESARTLPTRPMGCNSGYKLDKTKTVQPVLAEKVCDSDFLRADGQDKEVVIRCFNPSKED